MRDSVVVDISEHQAMMPVLLVAADATRRHELAEALTSWGHAPVAVADSDSVLHLLAQDDADGRIILVDGRGHAREAVACCRAIRDRTAPACVHYLLILAHEDAALLPEAFTVGATCLMMTAHDAPLLQARLLAIIQRSRRQVQQQAHLHALMQSHQTMKQDLHELVAIQHMYLPDRSHRLPGIDFDWIYRPAFIVSGDHIGLIQLSPTQIAFCMVDVMGHGIAAAMRALEMARSLSLHPNEGMLRDATRGRVRSPAEVAWLLNEGFKMTEASPIYCTLVYGILDVLSGEGSFVQAGHGAPLRIMKEGKAEALGEGGFPIGLIDDPGYEDIHFRLEPGDRLFLYSDGITESANASGQIYGDQRLHECLGRLDGSPGRQLTLLDRDVTDWAGSERQEQNQDDVSMLMLCYHGLASSGMRREPATELTGWHSADVEVSAALREAVASTTREPEGIRTLLLSLPDSPFAGLLPELTARGMIVDQLPLDDERLDRVVLSQYQLILLSWFGDLEQQRALLRRVMEVRQAIPIYVTAYGFGHSPEAELEALAAGADDFVTLPMSIAELKCRTHAGRQWISRDRILREALRQQMLLNDQVASDLLVVEGLQKSRFPRQGALHGEIEWGWLYSSAFHASADQIGVSVLDDRHLAFFSLHTPRRGMLALVNNWATSRLVSQEIRGSLLYDSPNVPGELRIRDPRAVMSEIHERYRYRKMSPYLCNMTYGVLDTLTGEGRLVHIGDHPPLLARLDGSTVTIGAVTEVLGSEQLTGIVSHDFTMAAGERLFMYSAGLCQLVEKSRDTRSVDHLMETLSATTGEPLLRRALVDLGTEVSGWQHEEKQQGAWHDVALLALQRGGAGALTRAALSPGALLADPFPRLCKALGLTRSFANSHGIIITAAALDADQALEIGKAAGDFALGQGLSVIDSYFIDLAVVEAATNISRHGYVCAPGRLDVWLVGYEGGVLVRLIDQGVAIPVACLDTARQHEFPDSFDDLDEVAEGGMGLPVIFKTMDAVHYDADQGGNSLLLFKRAAAPALTES